VDKPLVVLRPAGVKVVLVPGRGRPIFVEPSRTTSVTIARSGISGPKGDKGEKGEAGAIIITGEAPYIDGGNF
jgi:hypothetical protein